MNRVKLLAIFIALSIHTAAFAQTASLLTPYTELKGTAPATPLNLSFVDSSSVTKGTLYYNGAGSAGSRYFGFFNHGGDFLGFYSNTPIIFFSPVSTNTMTIANGGVSIGTNPADTSVRLTVNGAIDVKGNIAAKYQDVAEWVPAFGHPQPGTVVVLSEEANNHVAASKTAYDTRVAGVVSSDPGVILGEEAENKVKVATTGRVRVKVDASASPIKIGDLLVTSDKPGVAMKSLPVDLGGIKLHRPGTVVGKALEPLANGTGEILVLLSLQ
jgi:hypothetical protein